MNVAQLEQMTVDQLIEFVTGDRPQTNQPVEIVKSKLMSGYWEIFDNGELIGHIASVDSPGRISYYKGGYQVVINRQDKKEICFTGTIANCKSYAKSRLWK